MRPARPLLPVVALLCSAALAAPPAEARSSSEAGAGAGAGTQSGLDAAAKAAAKAAAAKKKAAQTQSRPPKRKVWTIADLEALRNDPSAQILILESKRLGGPSAKIRTEPAVKPQDVVDRYDRLAKEADAKLAELAKEKLAGSNPLLRGLASKTGGPRSPELIEADLKRWTSRRNAARSNRERAAKLTGVSPSAPQDR